MKLLFCKKHLHEIFVNQENWHRFIAEFFDIICFFWGIFDKEIFPFYARGPKFILLKCHCKIFNLAATQLLSARMNFWNNVHNMSEENNVRRLVTKSRIHLFESCKQALGQTNVYGCTSPPNILPRFSISKGNIVN